MQISFLWFFEPISLHFHINSTKVKKFSHGLLLQVHRKEKCKTKLTVSSCGSFQNPASRKSILLILPPSPKTCYKFFYGGHFLRQDITRAHDILRQDMHGAAKSLQVQVKNDLFLKIRHRNPEISPHKQNKRTIRVHFFVVFKPFLVLSIFLTWTFLVTKDNAVYSIFSQERYNVTNNSQANVKNYFC